MSNLKFFLAAAFITAIPLKLFSAGEADSIVYENDSVFTIQDYQEELKKDGEWIKVNKDEIDPEWVSEGTDELDDNLNTDYVWRPYGVDENWTPYTNGYWVYSNSGWMWTSYYEWGWRTCHYGRWWWSPVWGWVWSPGYVWAPSWVVWMFSGDYCGWYPISPRVRWHHHWGYRCHHMRFHVRHWTFCHTHDFHQPIKPKLAIDNTYNGTIINKTKFISNVGIAPGTVVNVGPVLSDVEKYTGKKYDVTDVTKYNNSEKFKEYKNADDEIKLKTKDDEKKIDEKKVINNKDKKESIAKEPTKNNEKKQNDPGKVKEKTPDVNKDKQENSTKEPPKNNNEKNNDPPTKQNYDKGNKNDNTPPPKKEEKQNNESKDKGKGN